LADYVVNRGVHLETLGWLALAGGASLYFSFYFKTLA